MLIALATPVAVFMSLVQAETALDHPLAYWPSELAAAGIGLSPDGDLAFGVHGQFPPG